VCGPASRAAPAGSRSSDRNFPKGFGLTAATDLRLQLTPTTEISAVGPGQTWCQSEREAVRDPSALHLLLTLTDDRRAHPHNALPFAGEHPSKYVGAGGVAPGRR
jgi:hypothetical protein